MNLTGLVLAASAALASTAAAAPVRDEQPWVLIGLDVNMGAVTLRDTIASRDTPPSVYGEGFPVYRTKAECETVMRRIIRKYANVSHAEGGMGHFVCTDVRKWETQQ